MGRTVGRAFHLAGARDRVGRPFDILDHTADIGIRAYGRTLPDLYENAARAMLSLMVAPESVRVQREDGVEVRGADAVDLMVSWLHEIIFRFYARGEVFAEARVEEFAEWRVGGILRGEPMDPGRHEIRQEIKGVTYHRARVEREGDVWIAEVVFDI